MNNEGKHFSKFDKIPPELRGRFDVMKTEAMHRAGGQLDEDAIDALVMNQILKDIEGDAALSESVKQHREEMAKHGL